MTLDEYARWLGRVSVVVAVIVVVWGLSVISAQPVTGWFAASAMISMALL